MHNRIRILLIAMGLVVVWLLFKLNSEQSNNQVVNTVSYQEKRPKLVLNPETKQKVIDLVKKSESIINEPVSENSIHSDDKRTYAQVYRDIQMAMECGNFYFNNHLYKGNYDYVAELTQAYRNLNKSDDLPPVVQYEAIEHFAQSCLSLKNAVFTRAGIDEAFPEYQFAYPVLVELRQELNTTKPETDAEKHLEGAIKFGMKWQQLFNQLVKVTMGEIKHPPSLIKMMQNEIQKIREDISLLYQINPVDGEQISLLEQQINNLHFKMEERLPASEEALAQAKAAFISINELMEKNLKAPYPQSFVEIIKTLQLKDYYDLRLSVKSSKDYWYIYLSKHFNWHKPPSHKIMQQSLIAYSEHFNLLIEPASLLYLCFLGDDCGPESAHVRKYCLNPRGYFQNNYPNACGKTLIDFYTEHYLSPNQWKDVSALFETMVNMYES